MNNFNQQGWEAQGDWRATEMNFWEAQRLEDVHQRKKLADLLQMATEAQKERQTMREDITYLIGASEDLSALFPPPQE